MKKSNSLLNYNEELSTHIVLPAKAVIGSALVAVEYELLTGEKDTFDFDNPNSSGGVQGINLVFADEKRLPVIHDYEPVFMTRDLRNNISFFDFKGPPSEMFSAFSASHTKIWSPMITQPLMGVDIVLLDSSPQACRFQFPGASIVVSIGYANEGDESRMVIFDGDDILIFSEDDWMRLAPSGYSTILIR